MLKRKMFSKAVSIILSLALLCTCFSGLVMAEEMDLVLADEEQLVEEVSEELAEVEEELPILEEDTEAIASSDFSEEESVNELEAEVETQETPANALKATSAFLAGQDAPTVGNEWVVLGLARGDYAVSENYFKDYYDKVVAYMQEKGTNKISGNKSSDNSRTIIGLASIGAKADNVGGYNLLEPLSDLTYLKKQGMNGPLWALIAFDSGNYTIPTVAEGGTQVTRDNLIEYLLGLQLSDGGWAMSGKVSDPDITGMVIDALAPYYSSNTEVKTKVDQAVECLAKLQEADGSYASWGTVNSESTCQVIVGLTSVGIDPSTDTRFIKSGKTMVDALMGFYAGEGQFKHVSSGDFNQMATEQAHYALVALDRFQNKKTSLYDMSDLTLTDWSKVPATEEQYVYFTVEKSTIGQGFIVEPRKVSLSELKEAYSVISTLSSGNLAQLTEYVLGENSGQHSKYSPTATFANYYLDKIKDGSAANSTITIPALIKAALDKDGTSINATRGEANWLSQMDYTQTAGWLFSENNAGITTGAGEVILDPNDIFRLQFSVYGYGGDVLDSSSWGSPPLFAYANKDSLIKAIADINYDQKAAEYGSNYTNAVSVLGNWEATQNQVDAALAALKGENPPIPQAEPIQVSFAYVTYNTSSGGWVYDIMPTELEVKDGVAEEYGFTPNSSATGQTFLDALVAMHAQKYGESFSQETAADYLEGSSYLAKAFGHSNGGACSMYINGAVPVDSNTGWALTLDQMEIQAGDYLVFFDYQDTTTYTDVYSYFYNASSSGLLSEMTVEAGQEFSLNLRGSQAMSANADLTDDYNLNDLIIKILDPTTGKLNGDTKFKTDSSGLVTMSLNQAGTYYLSTSGVYNCQTTVYEPPTYAPVVKNVEAPVVPPCLKVVVTPAPITASYPVYENKVYDDFENDLWLQYDFQELTIGSSAVIYPRRVPQAVTNVVTNDVDRPNFNFEIVEGDSITLSGTDSTESVTATAVKPGDTVVMVTYDAFNHKNNKEFAACSVVNTGYVIYSVPDTTPAAIDISTSIKATSYDTYYYTGDNYALPFMVNADGASSLQVTCNGQALTADNGFYTALLGNRSNIIGVIATDSEGHTKSWYQVVDARKIEIKIANAGYNTKNLIYAGDTAEISFRGITPPVYKLATIYNPTFTSVAFGNKGTYVHYTNPILGLVQSTTGQYNLATANTITVTFASSGSYNFSEGGIFTQWWGSALGTDKGQFAAGAPNLNADQLEGEFSSMPSFTVEVAPVDPNAFAVSFDLTNLAYDQVIASAENYSVTLLPTEKYPTEKYGLPESIEVTVGSSGLIVGTDYSYNSSSGLVTIPQAKITGNLVIKASGVDLIAPETVVVSGSCGDNALWSLTHAGNLTIKTDNPSSSGQITEATSASGYPWYNYRTYVTKVMVQNGISNLPNNAFSLHTNLTSAELADSVTVLGASVFQNCNKLSALKLPSSLQKIDVSTFLGCSALETITLPSKISSIGNSAFMNCKNLKTINLPNNVTSLGNTVFSGCTNLESLVLNEGLQTIGTYLLRNNTKITELTIPSTVTNLAANCLNGSALTKITILSNEVIMANATTSIPNSIAIYGYVGSTAEAYAATNGNEFVAINVYAPEVTTSNGQAKATVADLGKDITGISYVLDLTSSGQEFKNVQLGLNQKALGQLAGATSTLIKTDLAQVKLDQATLGKLTSSGDLTLNIEQKTNAQYPDALAYEINLADSQGNKLLTDGNNGITLRIPYDGEDYANKEIYLFDAEGRLIKQNAVYENGYFVVALEHLSEYLLMNAQEVDNGFMVSAFTVTPEVSGTEKFAVDLVVSSSQVNSFASLQTTLNYDSAVVSYQGIEYLVSNSSGHSWQIDTNSAGKVKLTLTGNAVTLSSGQYAVARLNFTPLSAGNTQAVFTPSEVMVGTTAQVADSKAAATAPLTVNLHNLVVSFAGNGTETTLAQVDAYAKYNQAGLYTNNSYSTAFAEPIATVAKGYLLKTNAQGQQLWSDGTNEYSFAEIMTKGFTANASFTPAFEVQIVSGTINFIADTESESLNYFAAPAGYHLLVFTPDSSGHNYTYDGKAMFKAVNMYNGKAEAEVFLYFVPVGVNTAEIALAKMDSSDNVTCTTITYNKDLNLSGGLNIIDAQIAYDLYTELSNFEMDSNFSLLGMRSRLEADVNKDGTVNTTDAWSVQHLVLEQLK